MKVLIISGSDLQWDERVGKQVDAMATLGSVSTISFGKRLPKVSQHWRLRPDGLTGLEANLSQKAYGVKSRLKGFVLTRGGIWERLYWSRPWVREMRAFASEADGFDLVICNEWDSLPAARLGLGSDTPIILDCHEYSPGERSGGFIRYLQARVSEKWTIPNFKAVPDAITFAGQAVADLYRHRFCLDGFVIKNVSRDNPSFAELNFSHRVAYVGRAEPNRGIELILEAAGLAPHLDWVLYLISGSSNKYKKDLQKQVESLRHVDLVFDLEHEELVNELARHSGVGLAIYPQSSENNSASLPNKFFDYISGGLAIVFSPTPDMKKINQRYGVGVPLLNETPKGLLSSLQQLTQDDRIEKFKSGSKLASIQFNWGEESKKLIDLARGVSLERRE